MPTTTPGAPARTPAEEAEAAYLWTLVEQIQGAPGDHRDPFAELYRRTYRIIYHFARGRVGRHEVAEDIAAETYLRALKRISRLQRQDDTSPAAWLVTIARNLVADHFKKADTRLSVLVAEMYGRTSEGRPEGCYEGFDETAEAAIEAADQVLLAVALYGAVSRLTQEQREVVKLRYLKEVPVSATAAAMGKNEGAIKALTYRATRTLARDPELVAAAGPGWLAA